MEFALILIVKQSSAIIKTPKLHLGDDDMNDDNMIKECGNVSNSEDKFRCLRKNNIISIRVGNGADQDKANKKSVISTFQALPITTRIDFVAFVLANFIFIIFNIVYFVWF